MVNKRITVPVNQDIDAIKERLAADTGIRMSYIQIINFLIHFYMTKASEPRSQWATLKSK